MNSKPPKTENNPLLLDHQLCFPLYAATNLLTRVYRPMLEPLGLTYSQYLVMLVLWERSPVKVGDLGDCLHLENGTLTPLLKRMEHGGFITRQRDPGDERRVLIALTPHGDELRHAAKHIPEMLSRQLGIDEVAGADLRNAVKSLVGVLTNKRYQNSTLSSKRSSE